MPEKMGAVGAGHRLVCLFNGIYITAKEGTLYADGSAFHHASGEVVEAHCLDPFLVVTTSKELLILR